MADGASSTNVSCGYLLVCVGTRTESVNWSYRSNCCDNSILLLLPLYACPSMIEKGSSPEGGCQRGWARLPVPSGSALLAGGTHAQSELAEDAQDDAIAADLLYNGTWKSIRRSCNRLRGFHRCHLPTRRLRPCIHSLPAVAAIITPSHLPPLPSLTPFSRARLASLPGPSTVSPSSFGPQEDEKMSTWEVLQILSLSLTLSKAWDSARPSRVSDILPSSIL